MPTPEIRHAYELLGRITAKWGEVEMLWYLIFTCLVGAPRPTVDAIFLQFQTGAAQRQMTMSVAAVAFDPESHERQELGRIHAQTNDAAGLRNAAVHGVYMIDPLNSRIGLRIIPGINHQRPNKLSQKQLDEALPEVLAAVTSLAERLAKFREHLLLHWLPPDKRTLPPELPPEARAAMAKALPELLAQRRREQGWPPLGEAPDSPTPTPPSEE